MTKTFADTFYYLALLNPGDQAHRRALEVTAQRWGTGAIPFCVFSLLA
jgi:hypothetical protein